MPENKNAWVSLANFMQSWRGVLTVFIAVGGSIIGTLMLAGERLAEIYAAPQDVDRLEAMAVDGQRARDSLAAALTMALRNHSLFINLFRCEQLGYPAHECPLLQEEMDMPAIPENAARAEIPTGDDDG
jgi:hypothetical protein